jgi:hypothetical protein
MLWRPVIATAAMIAATALLWDVQPVLALVAGTAVYGGVLLTLRPFTQAELNRLLPLLPVKRLRPNAGADPIR